MTDLSSGQHFSGQTAALIGDSFTQAAQQYALTSPSSGLEIARVADCGVAEANAALEASVSAFAMWRKTTAYERSSLLRKWFNLILRDEQELAHLIALEMGKPVTEALGEVRYAASFIEWYAEEAKRVYGEVLPSQFGHKTCLPPSTPSGRSTRSHRGTFRPRWRRVSSAPRWRQVAQ